MYLDAVGSENLAFFEGMKRQGAVCHFPQHGVGRAQQHGGVEVDTQLRCDGDVVVVAVGAHHSDDVSAADGLLDSLGIMGGVDDDELRVVSDDPDVVVDFPTAAVQFEGAVGDHPLDAAWVHHTTTDRSTSPACIFVNACST